MDFSDGFKTCYPVNSPMQKNSVAERQEIYFPGLKACA